MASGFVVLSAATATAGGGNPGGPGPENKKISLCHRTNAETNPYVNEGGITPSKKGAINGHDGHTGPIFAAGMKAGHDKWGDIIPPFQWSDSKGQVHAYAGLNWSAEGQAIFNAGCKVSVASPSASPSKSPSPSKSVTPSKSPSPSKSVTPSVSPSPSKSVTPSESVSPSESVTTPPVTPSETVKPSETVAGTTAAAPTVLGTQATAPTAVEAGLASWPDDRGPSAGALVGRGLVGGGLVLLLAGAWFGLGRRQRGRHEA